MTAIDWGSPHAAATLLGRWLSVFGPGSTAYCLGAIERCVNLDELYAVTSLIDDAELVIALLERGESRPQMRHAARMLLGRRSWSGWRLWAERSVVHPHPQADVEPVALGLVSKAPPARLAFSGLDRVARSVFWTLSEREKLSERAGGADVDTSPSVSQGDSRLTARTQRWASAAVRREFELLMTPETGVVERHLAVLRLRQWLRAQDLALVIGGAARGPAEAVPWVSRAVMDSHLFRSASRPSLLGLLAAAGTVSVRLPVLVSPSPTERQPAWAHCLVHATTRRVLFCDLETTLSGSFHSVAFEGFSGFLVRSGSLWEFLERL